MCRVRSRAPSPLGDVEQRFRADPPERGVIPARQRFRAQQPVAVAGELRLEQDFDLALPDGRVQFHDAPAAATIFGATAVCRRVGHQHGGLLACRAAPVIGRAGRVANRDGPP
jgi:hypothetical protein